MQVKPDVDRRWPSWNCVTPAMAAAAITANHGQLTYAAKDLGISISSLSHMVKRHEKVARARDEAKERLIDKSTLNVGEAVERGDLKASLFVLSTIGRHRDWRLPSGNDLHVGDTINNAVTIQNVTITSVPSGRFVEAPDRQPPISAPYKIIDNG